MSFDAIERSIDLGKPIRLYKFVRSTVTWAYNTSRIDITYQSIKFKSLQISDAGIRQSGSPKADAFEITAPRDLDVAQLFRGVAPSDAIEVYVYDMHYGDTEAIIAYVGIIYDVKFPAQDRCTIICNTEAAGLGAMGLRFTWSRGCQYVFGDEFCGANKEFYKTTTEIQSMDGLNISSGEFEGFDDGWFAGGYVEWPIGNGLYEKRGITKHVGSLLEIMGGTDGITMGIEISVFPGCRRTVQACNDDFNNLINYGGAADAPGINPFGSDPIF